MSREVVRDYIQSKQQELTRVRPPSKTEAEVLGRLLPGVILFHTRACSLGELVSKNPNSFRIQSGYPGSPNYLDARPAFRDYVPPELDVAICPQPRLVIPGTPNLQFVEIVERMQEYSAKYIEPELPDAKAIILPVSSIVQIDFAYARRPETMGETLFKEPLYIDTGPYPLRYGCYVFALNITGELGGDVYAGSDGPYVAMIGRSAHQAPFDIHGHIRNQGRRDLGGMLATVFLKAD